MVTGLHTWGSTNAGYLNCSAHLLRRRKDCNYLKAVINKHQLRQYKLLLLSIHSILKNTPNHKWKKNFQEKLTTASGFQWETGGSGSIGAPSLSRSVLIFLTPEVLDTHSETCSHAITNSPITLQSIHFSQSFFEECLLSILKSILVYTLLSRDEYLSNKTVLPSARQLIPTEQNSKLFSLSVTLRKSVFVLLKIKWKQAELRL